VHKHFAQSLWYPKATTSCARHAEFVLPRARWQPNTVTICPDRMLRPAGPSTTQTSLIRRRCEVMAYMSRRAMQWDISMQPGDGVCFDLSMTSSLVRTIDHSIDLDS
jgi:hypothetical protein